MSPHAPSPSPSAASSPQHRLGQRPHPRQRHAQRGDTNRPAITLHELSFEWPDGNVALERVNGTFNAGRSGLVGRNGTGKSTLLKLMAGELTPTSGRVELAGTVGYLPQHLPLRAHTTVAQLLGVDRVLAAISAVESGDVAATHFDTIGDDWDIAARVTEALARFGFPKLDLNRRVTEYSGGEAMLLAIAGLRIQCPGITLLDEPTNNLDREARALLAELIAEWPGTLIVVSHDVELLERMEHTVELHRGRLTTFGGPYSAWREHQVQEQAAAVQAARTAKQTLQAEKRQRVEAETKLARRARTAKKAQQDGGLPRIIAGLRASNAEASAGSMRSTLDDRLHSAQQALDAADARVREEDHVRLVLPDPGVPSSRRIAEFTQGDTTFVVQGPERIALVGPNGSGKSTLLAQLVHGTTADPVGPAGQLFTDRVGYLPQGADGLNSDASAVENIREATLALTPGEIRNQLARLLLRGDATNRAVATLSGGERFRVSLARLLLADPPAQVLVLDEPTNNLDLSTREHLAEALEGYRGALIIVSHDEAFLERIGIDTVLELDREGRLRRGAGFTA